jgi:hypothetical protein
MKVLFVTGSDAAFFNSLLILLQSFAERMPGQRLLICDFGLKPAQARFLRDLDVLVPRPAELAARGVFACKAALAFYLRANGSAIDDYDALVWLDADLMLMDTGFADFAAVVSRMKLADAAVAACREPLGRNIGQMIATFPAAAKMAPFAQFVARSGIAREATYFSTGLVFCRSTGILQRWMELAHAVPDHPLFEQSMFNVARCMPLRRFRCPARNGRRKAVRQNEKAKLAINQRSTAVVTMPVRGILMMTVGSMTRSPLTPARTFAYCQPTFRGEPRKVSFHAGRGSCHVGNEVSTQAHRIRGAGLPFSIGALGARTVRTTSKSTGKQNKRAS